MDVNDDAGCLDERVVRSIFASRLAPTRIAFAFDLAARAEPIAAVTVATDMYTNTPQHYYDSGN
jgi:hypothetical protein